MDQNIETCAICGDEGFISEMRECRRCGAVAHNIECCNGNLCLHCHWQDEENHVVNEGDTTKEVK